MDKEQQKHLVAVEMALLALGMPPNLKGFYYIKDAVWMLLQSGGHIGNKHIFERLTSRYGAPNSAIVKSMRTAIKVTFDRGNSKSKAKWFGSLLNVERESADIRIYRDNSGSTAMPDVLYGGRSCEMHLGEAFLARIL